MENVRKYEEEKKLAAQKDLEVYNQIYNMIYGNIKKIIFFKLYNIIKYIYILLLLFLLLIN